MRKLVIFENKNILVGVSGSIASYKACELVRAFQKLGANVRVCMTPSAREFIGKLTFKALTNYEVLSDWKDGETGLEHIYWARWADVFVIAPASANTIAKLRFGITDNFLTSVALAFDKKIVIAPAMNTKMYENPATKENLEILKQRGFIITNPDCGKLACGEEGNGKLANIEDILLDTAYAIYEKPLKSKTVLITAGGTREHFDPIRYISNASSGKMGYALAKWSYILGAKKVYLISAPVCEKPISKIKTINVISANEMLEKVKLLYKEADIIIMNSAVADFRPKNYSSSKLKKDKETNTIELTPNPDILKFLGENKKDNQILVGFAAESENLVENAISKLKRKNLDCIIANELSVFSKDTHKGYIIFKNLEKIEIPQTTKEKSAYFILKTISEKL